MSLHKSEGYRAYRCLSARADISEADTHVRAAEDFLAGHKRRDDARVLAIANLDHWKDRQRLAARTVEKYCGQKQETVEADSDSDAAAKDCWVGEGGREPDGALARPGSEGG